jgi:phospholipid transport system substrate-binding protein
MIERRARFRACLAAAALMIAAPAFAEESPPASQTSQAVDDAVAFAKAMTDKATQALTDAQASEAEKLEAFQKVLAESLALDVLGKFMLGATRKTMSEAQIARYDAIFPDYITIQYTEQFADIVGKKLEVLDARALGARDVIVRTQFPRLNGAPIMVDWRVRKLKDGSQKMIDIIVAGVSIMLVKREEFSSFIAQHGVDALMDRLEKEAGK